MSGVEALGIVASATQLAAYSIKIALQLNDIYTEVLLTPVRTREHLNQVKELIEITQTIEQHQSLRSPVIHCQLRSTLLQAKSLSNTLRDRAIKYTESPVLRYWALFKGTDEKVILTGLNKLEREKSTLRLCIGIVHTDLLRDIQGSIDRLSSSNMPRQSGQRLGSNVLTVSLDDSTFVTVAFSFGHVEMHAFSRSSKDSTDPNEVLFFAGH